MLNTPKITVLMPVYNGEPFISEAIESILEQSYSHLELLIINDGSNDGSSAVISRFACRNNRIRFIDNKENKGLIATLNEGLALCDTEFIARQDQDDVSLKDRLERQVTFLKSPEHADIGICGSWIEVFGRVKREIWKLPVDHDQLCCTLLFKSALMHPSVMYRKSIFRDHDLKYSEDFPNAEDYGLWVEASKFVQIANIPEVLLKYRLHDSNVSHVRSEEKKRSVEKIWKKNFIYLGVEPTSQEIDTHWMVSSCENAKKSSDIIKVREWLVRIWMANENSEYISRTALRKFLINEWKEFCLRGVSTGFQIIFLYAKFPLLNVIEFTLGSLKVLKGWFGSTSFGLKLKSVLRMESR